ncbi:hypothetical protein ACUNV4_21525 [Granulosicoccus sp. 3-233]|uniref:hypothetical protein n=1 Tax=Granulosicoccus sp. 3-233 TaxID=3417969 RepID=UPI003D3458AC
MITPAHALKRYAVKGRGVLVGSKLSRQTRDLRVDENVRQPVARKRYQRIELAMRITADMIA